MDCFASLGNDVDMTSPSRGATCARGLLKFLIPPEKREQGMPGACCTRGLVCNVTRMRTRAYRYSRSSPAFPAQWLYAYFVLLCPQKSARMCERAVLTNRRRWI